MELSALVLGVGGNVSQGILKALESSGLRSRVISACIRPSAPGLFTADRSYVSPLATQPEFIPWIIKVCKENSISVILSGVEPVLLEVARHSRMIEQASGAICLVASLERLQIAQDKLKTCRWLRDHDFNYPQFAASDDPEALDVLLSHQGFPLIAKPRNGKGSHGIEIIRTTTELNLLRGRNGYVVQEIVGDSEHEYTVAVVCDSDGAPQGSMAMRRTLQSGTSVFVEAGEFPPVREYATEIARALRVQGPVNLQLRLNGSKPVCFEINLRFSGTTPIRARMGFNDVEWCIRHFVLRESTPPLPLVSSGIALRYWNEIYIDPQAYADLSERGRLDGPSATSCTIEDYGIRR